MSRDELPWKVHLQFALRRQAARRTDVLLGLPDHDDAGIAVADVPARDESPARGRHHAKGTGHRKAKWLGRSFDSKSLGTN